MRLTIIGSLLALGLCAGSAFAADCPAVADNDAELARLMESVRKAPNEMAARQISQELWAIWALAPDEWAQQMLDNGMAKRSSFDFLGALKDFDKLVDYCPHYAEGYNQRAFVNYLREDYAKALVDLDLALAISPDHIAALAGKALTLFGLGQQDEGQAVLRDALKLNPWLSERHLLQGPAPLPQTDL